MVIECGKGMVRGGRRRRRFPGGNDVNSPMAQTQSPAVITAHGGVKGGRSQDGVVADDSWGMTAGDKADRYISADGGPMELSDIVGTGDLGNAVVMRCSQSTRGMRRSRCDGGKLEPAAAIGVERQSRAGEP